ncbi:MAG: HAMP domain-containing protein [Chloroflexaceae bacterium]|nr:HAMP domain-containing protein [Chloroflexaceae bacterium]
MKLSTKLTLAYTVIVVVVSAMLSLTLYLELRRSQREVIRDQLGDILNLAVTQIDGSFHSLIVSPSDSSVNNTFYRIIQENLATIQGTSDAITRIYTLRQQADQRVVYVVDYQPDEQQVATVGQAVDIITPLLTNGDISATMVEEAPLNLPSGDSVLYGYAPIYDPLGRQDGALVIALDASSVIASEIRARNQALLIFAITLVVVGVLGFWLRRQTTPIGDLLNGAQRLTQGNLEQRVQIRRKDDLGALASAFNTMADSLQARIIAEQQALGELNISNQQLHERTHTLEQAIQEQQRLSETVRKLSLPVIPIADQIIVVPLIGTVDARRSADLIETLLQGVATYRSRVVLIDFTGVPTVDEAAAELLLQALEATHLLGARTLLVGIRPALAETLIHIGADLHTIETAATLQDGCFVP